MKPDSPLGFQFRSLIKEHNDGKPILSALRKMLWDPDFTGFSIDVPGTKSRPPDGIFHPSTHPLVGEWWLWHYLAKPEAMIPEVLEPESTTAIIIGHMMHALTEHLLLLAGVLVTAEEKVFDDATGAGGSMDGRIAGYLGINASFEFKSMNPMKLGKVDGLDAFIEKCPEYYAQAIEYQRLSGLRESRVVIMATSYPFAMNEITVPYDEVFALSIANKYLRVRSVHESGNLSSLTPCCDGRKSAVSKCEFRLVCPMAVGHK